ncbi:MAG TPA: enoyl-CoA hydratase-related protein [Longimicrobiales bacterium]|nr:enoyl-CoA hydratase-related protein [Longimicrobiales bacterium]
MTYDTVRVDTEDRIATLTIDRPEKRNALSAAVRADVKAALADIAAAGDARVVILTGAGDKAFVAGADIGEFAERTTLEQRAAMEPPRMFDAVADCPLPTIAMINGYALGGGCELALACDIRVAARTARLGQPEVRLGIIPGGGGTQRLPRLVGLGQAMRLILSGELIDAQEALRIGLVDLVADDADLVRTTRELAAEIAARSPVAVRLAREAIRASLESPLGAGLRAERELFLTAFGSDDRKEGVSAFLNKREPEWPGA